MRLILLLALTAGCARNGGPAALAPVDTTVRFEGRRIDLAPFLVGHPYQPVLPVWDEGLLLVDHQGASRTLRVVPADLDGAPPDLAAATPLTDVDFDRRNRWGLRHHAPTGHLYWQGDEVNDEKIDLWRLPLDGGAPERLTDEPYLYGFSFSPDAQTVALLPRRGEGPFRSCLDLMAPDSTDRREILCDTPQAAFTWHRPSWSPDGQRIITRVNVDGQRSRGNLALVDLQAPGLTLLLDPGLARRRAEVLEDWLDVDRPVFVVDDDDTPRVLARDLRTHADTLLWTARQDLRHVELLDVGGEPRLLVVEHDPRRDVVYLLAPGTPEPLDRVELPGTASWLGEDEGDDGARVLFSVTSAETPLQTFVVDVATDGLEARSWLGLPPDTEQQMVRCAVEPVSIPTWDADPATGAARQLHAFLYTPVDGPPREQQLARITAFYGGSNTFSEDTQIHCAAGIATLSPAVRGSRGFGPAFAALNDGDLGGDEIVDLFAAARWLEGQGFDPSRIGVYGGSHGGYATMRALTFPPGTNDHGEDVIFPFAFGVSRAGFSDIVTFWETCNIPDWVLLEAGDPATEADRLHARSPLAHVDRLRAPLVLVHGENDSRVPVRESRQMAAACAEVGAPCTYVEFPAMGHHIQGIENRVRVYETVFGVLETVGD